MNQEHVFPISVGTALRRRIENDPRRVVAVLGADEVKLGSTWEYLNLCGGLKIRNITIICPVVELPSTSSGLYDVHKVLWSAADAAQWWVEELEDMEDPTRYGVNSGKPVLLFVSQKAFDPVTYQHDRDVVIPS